MANAGVNHCGVCERGLSRIGVYRVGKEIIKLLDLYSGKIASADFNSFGIFQFE
jgi:hypothetical protein